MVETLNLGLFGPSEFNVCLNIAAHGSRLINHALFGIMPHFKLIYNNVEKRKKQTKDHLLHRIVLKRWR